MNDRAFNLVRRAGERDQKVKDGLAAALSGAAASSRTIRMENGSEHPTS
jgi:hypothetical protein